MPSRRPKRTYDHRLVRLVQETGDATIATGLGIPRSTVAGWLRRKARKRKSASVMAVHPRTAQALARHSKLELTMQTYTDVRLLDLRSALESADLVATSSSRRHKKVVG